MAHILASLTTLCLATLATSKPVVTFPFNSQLPPVARISEPFSFSFSPQTFTSELPISYSIKNGPQWLSIDSGTRRLFGTPTQDSIGPGQLVGIPVEIDAADSSGVATANFILVVSRDPAPTIHVPIADQMAKFGDFSTPNTLLTYASTLFKFSFAQDTFLHPRGEIHYYAVSADKSPLPAWIQFDNSVLTFSGLTPPIDSLVQPPQKFDFLLVGSDVVGFSATSVPFSIAIGKHKLASATPVIKLNATRGTPLSYRELRNSVRLDGEQLQVGNATALPLMFPPWLSLDPLTWEIRGTPPNSAQSEQFVVTIRDSHSATLNITVDLEITSKVFRSALPPIDVRTGRQFSVDLSAYFWNASDVTIQLDSNPKVEWIRQEGLVISGIVPPSVSLSEVNITVQARARSSETIETEVFSVKLGADDPRGTRTQASGTGPTSTSAGNNMPDLSHDDNRRSQLALIIALPIAMAVIILIILLWLCRRRYRQKDQTEKLLAREISGPLPGSFMMNGAGEKKAISIHDLNRPFDTTYITVPINRCSIGNEGDIPRSSRSSMHSVLSTSHSVPAIYLNLEPQQSRRLSGSMDRPRTRRSQSAAAAGWRRSQTMKSHRSDTTFPDDHHELLSGPDYLKRAGESTFRNGLDITIPALDETSSIQETPEFAYGNKQKAPIDFLSAGWRNSHSGISPAISSSDALPSVPSSPGTGIFGMVNAEKITQDHARSGRKGKGLDLYDSAVMDLQSDKARETKGEKLQNDGRPVSRPRPARLAHQRLSTRYMGRRSVEQNPFMSQTSIPQSDRSYNPDSDDSEDEIRGAWGTENWQVLPLGIRHKRKTSKGSDGQPHTLKRASHRVARSQDQTPDGEKTPKVSPGSQGTIDFLPKSRWSHDLSPAGSSFFAGHTRNSLSDDENFETANSAAPSRASSQYLGSQGLRHDRSIENVFASRSTNVGGNKDEDGSDYRVYI
jgi:axial budding pattern protein 2